MGSEIPPSLREIAHIQGGIVTRKQAIHAGLSSGAIISKLKYRRWQQIYRGVYATFSGPLSRTARLWAAVLYAGNGAELSHETAAELHGLATRRCPLIHVSVPASRRVHGAVGLVIHVSARAGTTRFQRGEIPHTPVDDTIVDLVDVASSPDDVRELVNRAITGRITTDRPLRAAAGKRKRMRWRREFGQIIAAASPGTRLSGTTPPAAVLPAGGSPAGLPRYP